MMFNVVTNLSPLVCNHVIPSSALFITHKNFPNLKAKKIINLFNL